MTRKWMARLCCALSALLAGCSFSGMFHDSYNIGAYGIPTPPLPHDPTVRIEGFSYTPASPVHLNDTLTLQAHLNKPTEAGYMQVVVKKPSLAVSYLNDAGYEADAVAGDGVFTGELAWTAELGTGKGLPVWVELRWDDGAEGQQLDGPPLTVLPEEVGQ